MRRNRNRPFRELQEGHANTRLHEKCHAICVATSKTLWDGQQLVSGIGCQPETAFDEFLSTKLLHHKDGGVMFYHMVQSFPKGAGIDPRTAHEAARRLAGYFEGCEVLVCTHIDREHIHSHCIINSVNFETGKKVHMADEQIQALRVRNDADL
ncbi:MAG: relaxase/mobilization nuclease domain-containing protein [Oscillospiraceae bacterium]